jgi:hypothetical protein
MLYHHSQYQIEEAIIIILKLRLQVVVVLVQILLLTTTNGVITAYNIVSVGTGYVSAPTTNITSSITSFTLSSGGSNYLILKLLFLVEEAGRDKSSCI